MKVFVSWAHHGEDWSATQADQWATTVELFAKQVDNVDGLDVELDRWHVNDRDMDWRRWGLEQVRSSDYVLIAMNTPWEQRWRGTNSPTQGSGAAAEADALRGVFERDQGEFQRKVRIVMLPGAHGRDIPEDLFRLKRITITDLSADGIQPLADDLKERSTRPGGPAGADTPNPLVLGPDSLMLLRYRDLVRPTITSHRAVLESAGHVWWGWWKKFHENPQLELWESLRRNLASPPCRVALFDSGSATGEVRRATVTEVLVPRLDEFDDCHPFSPDPAEWPLVPAYYRPDEYNPSQSCAWVKLSAIETRPVPFLGRFEFVSQDLALNGHVIKDPEQLTKQDQSLWHIRPTRRP